MTHYFEESEIIASNEPRTDEESAELDVKIATKGLSMTSNITSWETEHSSKMKKMLLHP